jgi:hypothetical protein
MKPRRTKLTPAEQVLLRKLQRGVWTADELSWIERHLEPDAPTGLVAEVRHRLQLLRANA